jgi:hypothetical protein
MTPLRPAPAAGAAPAGRLRLLLGLLVAVAALAVLSFWSGGTGSAPAPVTGRSRPGRPGAITGPEAVPVLQLAGVRGGVQGEPGRNVFRFYDSPTPTPTPVKPTPTPLVWYSLPDFPTPTPTPTPIIPPAIPYKAIGRFGPRDAPIVTLEEGGRLLNVREGDTLDGRFLVKKINRESVDFAFVGLPPDITRRLPVPLP